MAKSKTKEIKEVLSKKPSARDTVRISVGATQADEVFGAGLGPGIESGQIVQLYAPSQAGKTFLIMEAIFSAIQQFGDKVKYRYNASEDGNSFDTMGMYNFPITGHDCRSKTVEEWFIDCKKFCDDLADDEFGIYALDSMDGLITDEMQKRIEKRELAFDKGEAFDEGSYGMAKSKLLSTEIMPKIREVCKAKNCVIIIVHQMRQNTKKIGGIGPAMVISGSGEAVSFYADTRVYLSSVHDVTVRGRDIGYIMKVEAKKSRGPRGYRSAFINVFYQTGIDNVGTNIDYLFDFKTDLGAIQAKAEAVWDGIPDTMDNIKQFMNDEGCMEDFKSLFKTTSPKNIYMEYIKDRPTLIERFNARFGTPLSRQELIEYVEANNLEEELISRCKQKWEEDEAAAVAVLANRKPRFKSLIKE